MKIVFISVNSSYSHSSLAYGYLRAFNERFIQDCRWTLLETSTGEDRSRFLSKILDAAPDILVSTAYLFNVDYLMAVTAAFKTIMPQVPVYLGGPEFLGDNETFLRRNPHVSAVIRGDESSFHNILTQNNLKNISGLCCIDKHGNYIDDKMTASFDGPLDEIPSPFAKGYFNKGKAFCQIETSRGCPGACTFCTSASSEGVKYFSIDRVRSDIKAIASAGYREIRVLDRTFNENKTRALELLEIFRDEFPQIRFHLEINPALTDSSFINMLKTFPAGQLHLEAGIQTFAPVPLKAVKRPGSSGKSAEGLGKLTSLNNIEIHADLIAGLPHQTRNDVFEDLLTMVSGIPDEIQLETLKILPGTALRKAPSGILYNPAPPYEVLQTPTMSNSDILECVYLSKIIDCYYNSPVTKGIFCMAALHMNFFFENFTAFVRDNYDPFLKPAPASRLEILESFFESFKNEYLLESVRLLWLFNGFPPEKYGIKVFRKPDWIEGEGTLVESPHLKPGRFFSTDSRKGLICFRYGKSAKSPFTPDAARSRQK